jgi:FtsP/CotA-like multicopper oxidase with cupredoxin domain
MKRGIRSVLILALAWTGTLRCQVQQAQSQDPVFTNPPMLSSRDGRLDVDLVAAPGVYTLDGHQFQGVLYNGAYVPPIWRVRLGDTVTVALRNRLAEPTNLRFHGLGVSPLGNGDNVFLHVRPEETFTYQVTIPARHVGLFWFHPHMHGNVDAQIIGGMSGGIIVEGSERLAVDSGRGAPEPRRSTASSASVFLRNIKHAPSSSSLGFRDWHVKICAVRRSCDESLAAIVCKAANKTCQAR